MSPNVHLRRQPKRKMNITPINNGYTCTETKRQKYTYSAYLTKVYKLILSLGMRLSFSYIIIEMPEVYILI